MNQYILQIILIKQKYFFFFFKAVSQMNNLKLPFFKREFYG